MSDSAYSDIPDYDTDCPGLDLAEVYEAPHCPARTPGRTLADFGTTVEERMLPDEVRRRRLWDYQLASLQVYVRGHADSRTARGHAALQAVGNPEVAAEYSDHQMLAIYVKVPALRWLQDHRAEIEALFNQEATAFRLVRRLFE